MSLIYSQFLGRKPEAILT